MDEWFKYSSLVIVVEEKGCTMKGGEHTWAVSEPPAPGASSTAQTEMAAWGQICQPAPTQALALGVTLLGSAAGCLLGHQPLAFAGVRG